jgi:hypothetical protein
MASSIDVIASHGLVVSNEQLLSATALALILLVAMALQDVAASDCCRRCVR